MTKLTPERIAEMSEWLSNKHGQCLFTGLSEDEMKALNYVSALLADRASLVAELKQMRDAVLKAAQLIYNADCNEPAATGEAIDAAIELLGVRRFDLEYGPALITPPSGN